MPLDLMAAAAVEQMEQLEAVEGPVTWEEVSLAAGKGIVLRAQIGVVMATGKNVRVETAEYVFVRGKELWTITLATTADEADAYALTFDQIIRSFRWR